MRNDAASDEPMTAIEFHFNVPDRMAYTCRLLRKAARQGAGVAVTGPAATLGLLDSLLWSFDAIEFVPHVRLRGGEKPAARLRRTPLWLVDQPEEAIHQPVLVNLGAEPPRGFETFPRLIEVVGSDDEERASGRGRWKHYASRGYPISRHEVAA